MSGTCSFNLKMKSLFKNMIYKIRLFIYKSFRYFLYMCCGIMKIKLLFNINI